MSMSSWSRRFWDRYYKYNRKRLGGGTPYDPYKFEGNCPICGKGRSLYPLPMNLIVCPRCFKRFAYPDKLNATMEQSILGVTCQLCGRRTWIYYKIHNPHICLECMYKKIGKGKGKLKYAGSSVY